MPALGSGVTVNGDEVTRVGSWVAEMARRVDMADHWSVSGSGASSVDSAMNAAEVWRRGATAIVVADIADWGADLGDAAETFAKVDEDQAQAARDRGAHAASERNQVV